MSKAKKAADSKKRNTAKENFEKGCNIVKRHPMFRYISAHINIIRSESEPSSENRFALVYDDGVILCYIKQRAQPEQWARVIAHCMLHLAMDHFKKKEFRTEWNIACDLVVEKFLSDFHFGKQICNYMLPQGTSDEDSLYHRICESSDKMEFAGFGTAGNLADMVFERKNDTSITNHKYTSTFSKPPNWQTEFAKGLSVAVRSAVRVASGDLESLLSDSDLSEKSIANLAREWFISHYPLLGAIAANFRIIEDHTVCENMDISIAAVSPAMSEIYINPYSRLNFAEMKFVMAHEFLHAALRHDARQEWRDGFLWNLACDLVINQWLTEMGIGERPDGVLYDEDFKGLSAEAVYDIIAEDMRKYLNLATLRGMGIGDILSEERNYIVDPDLDDFYRRALAQGLEYHSEKGRGFIPAGLVEEIRALSHPVIPWDAELARWFDGYFTPLEKIRSYARPSRRQSSTPDIPRPYWVFTADSLDARTFGVVLDTSGSMDRRPLAMALGAITSYCIAKDVPAARVVFCDAKAYDEGYMKPEDIAGTVKVKGRGGTILQPGIDLLENAPDFPKDAPILIITDGKCDKVMLRGREHAFLMPQGAKLPFVPKGKVFQMKL